GYILSAVLLPDGASLDRTDEVARRVETFFTRHPAVSNVTMLGGMDLLGGGCNSTNAATMFVTLKPCDARETSAQELIAEALREFADDRGGSVLAFNPPSIQGLGRRSGFEMELQQRGGGTLAELAAAADALIPAAEERPEIQ